MPTVSSAFGSRSPRLHPSRTDLLLRSTIASMNPASKSWRSTRTPPRCSSAPLNGAPEVSVLDGQSSPASKERLYRLGDSRDQVVHLLRRWINGFAVIAEIAQVPQVDRKSVV